MTATTPGMADSGKPGGGRRQRSDWVYRHLLEAINAGEMRPGDLVREAEVADRLGVSRTPVREALQRLLSEEVLVKSLRSLAVPSLDDKQVIELYAAHEVVEGAAAGFAAKAASDIEIEVLARLVAEQASLPEDAVGQHVALNREFHLAIYGAANNRYLLRSLHSLQDAIARLGPPTFTWPGRAAKAAEEHQLIVLGITKRDPEAAEAAARAHIRASLRDRMLMIHARRAGSDGRR